MIDMKDFRIEKEATAKMSRRQKRKGSSDLLVFIRLRNYRIRMEDKRIVTDVYAHAEETYGSWIVCFQASAPLRHLKTDDWGSLLESAYDAEFLPFINNTMENMVTLWSFSEGQDVEIHKLTHLYF